MSDALDAVAEALARTKHLAATCLVRKQEAEAELARLQAAGLAADDARVAAVSSDLARATEEYRAALAEIAELGRLATRARQGAAMAPVFAAEESDPLIRTDEEMALDNARANISELGAQARLADELAPPRPAPAPATSKADADAEALAKFQELRAKRQQPPAAGDSAPPPAPPKKTI